MEYLELRLELASEIGSIFHPDPERDDHAGIAQHCMAALVLASSCTSRVPLRRSSPTSAGTEWLGWLLSRSATSLGCPGGRAPAAGIYRVFS
jgi:hypothetical protein